MKRRRQGSGSLVLRGRVWWMQFYVKGARFQESTNTRDRDAAQEVLKRKLIEVALEEPGDISPEKATLDDLCRLVFEDARIRQLCDLKTNLWRYQKNVFPALGKVSAKKASQQSKLFRDYIARRQREDASNATINRELAIVRRAFTLALREEPPLVRKAPYIPKLKEDNVRQGFLSPEDYERVLEECPMRLKALYVSNYHVGTRKNEIRRITWDQVDFEAGVIRLTAAQTKGKEARELPIYEGDMERWLRYQQMKAPKNNPYVFHSTRGRPVGSALLGWNEAVARAGFPGLRMHDMRRSAVRNMKRAKVSDTVAMKISGHKTLSIFNRYNITDHDDIKEAAAQVNQYLAKRKQDGAAKLRRVK